jgi:hypothetical protein
MSVIISGDGGINTSGLVIDENTLFVDSANNRVGIGTITPEYTLDLIGSANISGTAYITGSTSIGGNALVQGTAVVSGSLSASSINNTKAFYYNSRNISTSVTINSTDNVLSAGPITIVDGVTVTISDGGEWSIV